MSSHRRGVPPIEAVVPTTVGPLRALIREPAGAPTTGVVLVDGSGPGTADGWGAVPGILAGMGAAVLAHDKPGCGGSPGDWTAQTLADRASETLAAVGLLASHLGDGAPIVLYGVSQGGWVAVRAAAESPGRVAAVVSVSGPGVSPARQERTRIERELRSEGIGDGEITAALGWVDERSARLVGGEDPGAVLADQGRLADQPWYPTATRHFDDPATLGFLAGILAFDPADWLPRLRCPVFAAFGAADDLVPVEESVAAFARHLPALPGHPHALAVYPGADHGLHVGELGPGGDPADAFAPGYLAMLRAFLTEAGDQGAS